MGAGTRVLASSWVIDDGETHHDAKLPYGRSRPLEPTIEVPAQLVGRSTWKASRRKCGTSAGAPGSFLTGQGRCERGWYPKGEGDRIARCSDAFCYDASPYCTEEKKTICLGGCHAEITVCWCEQRAKRDGAGTPQRPPGRPTRVIHRRVW